MGETQKQLTDGDKVRMQIAPMNRPATNPRSKWSILYEIVAAKGVFVPLEDPERRDSMSGYHELSEYQATAIERGWFLRPESASLGPQGEATLGMLFYYAPGI